MKLHKPYEEQVDDVFKHIYNIIPREKYPQPSEWAVENRMMTRAFTSSPGRWSWDKSPYTKEILDCLSPDSPVREVAFMKASQTGATQGIIENYIGYTIDVYPRSVFYATADQELAEMNMSTRIDALISTANLSDKIRPSVVKKSNKKTGDTKKMKEFAGGVLYAFGANNANKMRQWNAAVGLFDEIDAWPYNSSGQGDPVSLFRKRTDAYEKTRKNVYISSPVDEGTSRIGSLFKKGDQRFYNVPCPHCGEFQVLKWGGEDPDGPGIKFEKDKVTNTVIRESIHYQCVKGCKIVSFEKYEMLKKGKWIPTAEPRIAGLRSYHLNALYSNFFSWEAIVDDWLLVGKDQNKLKIFVNNVLGETWKEDVKTIKSDHIMKNCRPYEPGIIPNIQAQKDGNGKIVLLMASVDVNKGHGQKDDKLGWFAVEITGHCRNGQTYLVCKNELHGVTDLGGNAWFALQDILTREYEADDGLTYRVNLSGIDCGFKPDAVYWFCSQNPRFIPIRGKKALNKTDKTVQKAHHAKGTNWSVETIFYKNRISEYAGLIWGGHPLEQPHRFMNFPQDKRRGGLEDTIFEKQFGVQINGGGFGKEYFKNYSAEYPIIQKEDPNDDDEVGSVVGWMKRSRAYNHFWDTRVYNFALIDIYFSIVRDSLGKEYKNYGSDLMMAFAADITDSEDIQFYMDF